jgi:hypothetical protein
MGLFKVMTTSLAVLFIASCGSPEPPPPVEKTVFGPMIQTEQRARDVQNTVDKNTEAARKAVDTQERGDTTP